MGKRKRRLHSPKYANKYAGVRATYKRLREAVQTAEADGVVTEEEAEKIEEVKKEVVQAVVESTKELVEETVAPVVEAAEKIVEKAKKAIEKTAPKQPNCRTKLLSPRYKRDFFRIFSSFSRFSLRSLESRLEKIVNPSKFRQNYSR